MGINKALKKTISVLLPIVSGVDFQTTYPPPQL
jgi:hypothetical protein